MPVVEGEILGLERVTYNVELKNEALGIDYEFSNKKLECRAEVPGSRFPVVSQGININLSGGK